MLTLKLIGEDRWSRPVYKDDRGKLWKDVECGMSETPCLHRASNNDFEGEPDYLLEEDYKII